MLLSAHHVAIRTNSRVLFFALKPPKRRNFYC